MSRTKALLGRLLPKIAVFSAAAGAATLYLDGAFIRWKRSLACMRYGLFLKLNFIGTHRFEAGLLCARLSTTLSGLACDPEELGSFAHMERTTAEGAPHARVARTR